MRTTCIILLCSLLASCGRSLAPIASTKTTDTVRIETVIHDTVTLLRPVVTELHDTIPFAFEYDTTVVNEGQTLTVRAHGGILSAKCQADSLKEVIRTLQSKITQKISTDSVITVTKEVKVTETKYPALFWWSIGLNGLSILGLFLKFNSSGSTLLTTVINFFKK